MKMICVTSPKGGDGATFVAANLAYALSRECGSCLAADLNIGRRTLDLTFGTANDTVFNLNDIMSDTCDPSEAIVNTAWTGLDFVTSSQTFDSDGNFCTDALKRLTQMTSYDYVVADIPREFEEDALPLCDMMIMVSSPSHASVRCLAKMCGNRDAFNKTYVVINKIIPELIESGVWENADDICDNCGIKPLGLIPFEPEAEIAQSRGAPAAAETTLKISRAAANMARRISGEQVCLVDCNYRSPYYKVFKKYI